MNASRLFLIAAAVAFTALSAVGLTSASASTSATTGDDLRGEEAAPAKSNFTLSSETTAVTVGQDGTITVTIVVGEGYHWNKEYPAVVSVAKTPKEITLKKARYSQLAGEFSKVEEHRAVVTIPVNGAAAGKTTVQMDARFSICSDKVCLIKKASVEVPLVIADR